MEEGTMADPDGPDPDDLSCRELVDTVTEYLDGAVTEGQQGVIERHLEGCEGCRVALDQFQTVIRLAGRLTSADVARIDAMVRDRLMATLRVMRRR
jgi:predicted anti-sigma-YlaC factor YlaD